MRTLAGIALGLFTFTAAAAAQDTDTKIWVSVQGISGNRQWARLRSSLEMELRRGRPVGNREIPPHVPPGGTSGGTPLPNAYGLWPKALATPERLHIWKDHTDLPEWLQRGNCRLAFIVDHKEDYAATGCNSYRMTGAREGMEKQGVHLMSYISPTDCFWHGKLLKLYGYNNQTAPAAMKWIVNMLENFPYLKDALVCNPDGNPKVIHAGTDYERMVGCRNNPVWKEFRRKDLLYRVQGAAPFVGDPDFSRLPDIPYAKDIRAVFVDNAGIVPCACKICKAEWETHRKEREARGMPSNQARKEFDVIAPTKFNEMLKNTAHGVGRYTMANYTLGGNFVSLNQMNQGASDAGCWELSWQHTPWGRIAPWYKRALAAGDGLAIATVTQLYPPAKALEFTEMPEVTPEFTQMALAEAFATQGTYIIKGELLGGFTAIARRYNHFNSLNQRTYRNAQPGGRIAMLVPLVSGLLHGRADSITDDLANRLMGAGVPIEMIVEDDLREGLRDHFDVILAPDFTCVTDAWVEALADFQENGGGLLLSPDFASRDRYFKPVANKTAQSLMAKPRVFAIKGYGEGMETPDLVALVAKAAGGALPQRVRVGSPRADFAVNALKQPDLESYHIVNYSHFINPAFVLKEKIAVCEFPAGTKGDLYIYGLALNGGVDLDISLNGEHAGTLKAAAATKREWHKVDMAKAPWKAGANQVVIRPNGSGKGEFVLYEQPGGYTVAVGAKPSKVPLKTTVAPLSKVRLELKGQGRHVAFISPDRAGTFLTASDADGNMRVDIPDVHIYSVVLVSRDRELLEKILRENETEVPPPITGRDTREDYEKLVRKLRGTSMPLEYAASSSHGAYAVNGMPARLWLDGTPGQFPDWVEGRLKGSSKVNKVAALFDKTRISSDFEIQVDTGGEWKTVGTWHDNRESRVECAFAATVTDRVRVLITKGLRGDPRYASLQGIEVSFRE